MSNNPTRYIKSVAHQPVDPGIHGQIVDSMSNTTDKRTNAPSIRMAMSNGLPAGAIVEYTGNEVPDGYRRRDDIPTLSELNDNLSGFKFYPTGTGIVGLIADDSAYMDEDGNYVVWGTATANQLVEDNPNTYKSVPSTEDCRGEVGADSAVPFKGGELKNVLVGRVTAGWNTSTKTVDCTSIPNYQELTVDNFTYEYTSITGSGNGGSATCNPSMSYNPSNGVLTLTGLSVAGSGWNGISSATIEVYCYYIE